MPQWIDSGYLVWGDPKPRDGMFDAGEPVPSFLREFPALGRTFDRGLHPHGDPRIAMEPVRPLMAEVPVPPIRTDPPCGTRRLDGKILSDPLPPVLRAPPWLK